MCFAWSSSSSLAPSKTIATSHCSDLMAGLGCATEVDKVHAHLFFAFSIFYLVLLEFSTGTYD
jgi:hypothetical protein